MEIQDLLLRTTAYSVLGLYVLINWLEPSRTADNHKGVPRKAQWTLYWIGLNNVLMIVLSFVEFQTVVPHPGMVLAGLVLFLLRTRLKHWSMQSLGESFHIHIAVSSEKKLVTNGPYAWIRHPTYASRLMGCVGIPLMMNAYRTLALMIVLDAVIVGLRIFLEERELIRVYNNQYREYKKRTGALIPRLRVFRAG